MINTNTKPSSWSAFARQTAENVSNILIKAPPPQHPKNPNGKNYRGILASTLFKNIEKVDQRNTKNPKLKGRAKRKLQEFVNYLQGKLNLAMSVEALDSLKQSFLNGFNIRGMVQEIFENAKPESIKIRESEADMLPKGFESAYKIIVPLEELVDLPITKINNKKAKSMVLTIAQEPNPIPDRDPEFFYNIQVNFFTNDRTDVFGLKNGYDYLQWDDQNLKNTQTMRSGYNAILKLAKDFLTK